MSRSTQPLSEIHSGTHLVIVLEASFLRDQENLPVVAKDGSYGVKIRFNDNKLNMDWTFWTKFSDFKKLCKVTACDPTKPVLPELRGKRLWMCVKEVKTMKEDVCIETAYVPFDYIVCDNPQTKPIVSGDPCQHPKGLPLGVFVEYSQRNVVAEHPLAQHPLTEKDMLSQEEKLAIGKKIIAEGEKKELTSLNQKNIVNVKKDGEIISGELVWTDPQKRAVKLTPISKEEQQKHDEISENDGEDIFASAEGPEESKDNNHVEDDWDAL